MPKRSNRFQDVVALIHRHMAGPAQVQESAPLVNSVTRQEREVDVAITTTVAGQNLTIAVEATAPSRPADVGWVEEMMGKHENLPTHKVVLVSEAGFTKQARELAASSSRFVAVEPHELGDEELERSVLQGLRSVWPKAVTYKPEKVVLTVRRPDQETTTIQAPDDLDLALGSDERRANVREAVLTVLNSDPEAFMEKAGIRDAIEDRTSTFVLKGGPLTATLADTGETVPVCARYVDGPTVELHPVVHIEIAGTCDIRVHGEMQLSHIQLGDVVAAYGETTFIGQRAVVVATSVEGVEIAVMRVRDSPSADARDMPLKRPRGTTGTR